MDHSHETLELVPSSSVHQGHSGVTGRDVAAVLFRRKKTFLVLFFSILAGSALGATWLRPYLSPTRFVSELKFIIKKDRFDAVITPADRAVPGLTTTVTAQEIYSEIELLKSTEVLERLAAEAGLPGSATASEMARAVERLKRNLVAEPVVAGRNVTNLIAVRYSSSDAEEVARVLKKLPELYLDKHLSVNRRPAALEYFRSQAEASEQELLQAEEEVAEFEKQQPSLSSEGSHAQVRQKLADLEKQRSETEAAIREAESRTSELTRQLNAVPATIPMTRVVEDPPYVQRLKTQLLELENRRAQATFYREIEQLERRIAETRKAIGAETPAPGARTESSEPNPLRQAIDSQMLQTRVSLAGLRARRASLLEQERSCREQLAASRLIAAENSAQSAELVRHVKTAEENFSLYRKKYAEAREAETLDQKRVLNVSLAEGPRPPAPVEKRDLWVYLAIGFLVALAGGTSAGFAAEIMDHSIHTPRQLESCSSLPVLACIAESRQR